MGLFSKKFCDVCGDKIGLLGNRKLEDGNLCKECAKLLSPFMTDRRQSTVTEIKEHLEYRKANQGKVAAFSPTKIVGGETKIYFDENKKQWLVTRLRDWRSENPDVIDFSQAMGCILDIDEDKWEIYHEVDGRQESFNPRRYEYSYVFNMTIHVNSPWFSEIQFRINDDKIEQRGGIAYCEAQAKADEIKNTLEQMRSAEREAAATANMPKTATLCSHCQATTIPDANGCCEYCGGAIRG
ncbi:MAG: DUF4428 domain-containing protein [Firmicutes bacterium]|nr:DUF4428 domain-containing protein [Bacillota bacterium]